MDILNKIKKYKIIIKNTGYLSIIEIIRLIMPFIALPYVIRTVGAENYGTAIFIQTIIAYFSIFINWGLDISAVKDISVNRDNPYKLNNIVSTVLGIKTILFIIAFVILVIGLFSIPFLISHQLPFIYAFLTCLSEILFPIWFYQGIEKMKYLTIIRTTSILFYTITVFIFIKGPEDYERILLLQSLGNIIAGIISVYLLIVVNKINLVKPSISDLKRTFIESFSFFSSRVSVVLNNTLAKTISGIFFTMEAVAAFDLAQRIANVSLIPIRMLNQAIYPHIAKTLNIIFVKKILLINCILSFLVALFIFLIAPIAIQYFADRQLLDSIIILRILTMWIFLGGITTFIGAPVLVSFGYSKPFNRSVFLSTITLLSLYLLMFLLQNQSIYVFALILVISELVILIYRLYYCYKNILYR